MGEIADAMLDGEMCQWCGVFLDEVAGYPTICPACQKEENVDEHGRPKQE